jgi:hypothetical protein
LLSEPVVVAPADLTVSVLSLLTVQRPPAMRPQRVQKVQAHSWPVAVLVALTASSLDWLTACPLLASVAMASVSLVTVLSARRARWFPAGLTVPDRLMAGP